jgi:hypothetical protein
MNDSNTAVTQELPSPQIEQIEEEWTALGCGCQTDWTAGES